MDRTRAIATASDGNAAEAAMALLAKGNAVDAVVAGVFGAAAGSASVLLGPVHILFGGAGLGLRVVDGRVRQPGKGAPRPRGFTSDQPIAPASRVGVSALPAALAAALASSGTATLAQAMGPAVASASGPRKELLQRISRRGPSALASEPIAGEIVAMCGRVAGGLVTVDDLDAVLPAISPAEEVSLAGPARKATLVPWRRPAITERDTEVEARAASHVEVVAATDHRGLFAIACYERPEDGVAIEALGVTAPFVASPVLRGQARVRPGVPIVTAAPIALLRTSTEGAMDVAIAVARDADAERALGQVIDDWSREGSAPAPSYRGRGSLVGVVGSKSGASLLARQG
jgi:gamma-glutamyltranspeptidase/glutathione hydrolase